MPSLVAKRIFKGLFDQWQRRGRGCKLCNHLSLTERILKISVRTMITRMEIKLMPTPIVDRSSPERIHSITGSKGDRGKSLVFPHPSHDRTINETEENEEWVIPLRVIERRNSEMLRLEDTAEVNNCIIDDMDCHWLNESWRYAFDSLEKHSRCKSGATTCHWPNEFIHSINDREEDTGIGDATSDRTNSEDFCTVNGRKEGGNISDTTTCHWPNEFREDSFVLP